jgi:hypothetical protein
MAKIKRILLDKHLNPIEGYNFNDEFEFFNDEFEFSTITEAFEAFHELENKCKNRINICNSCFIAPFNSIMCWYIKFVVEN